MNIEELEELTFDFGVVDALGAYLKHGLHPGSFGYYLLVQNYEMANRSAHFKLKPDGNYHGADVVANMILMVKHLMPPSAFGTSENVDHWMSKGGFSSGEFESELIQMKLTEGQWDWWSRYLDEEPKWEFDAS